MVSLKVAVKIRIENGRVCQFFCVISNNNILNTIRSKSGQPCPHISVINVVDVVALVGHILGTSPLTSICEADTNDDGILNVVDVVALVGMILGD